MELDDILLNLDESLKVILKTSDGINLDDFTNQTRHFWKKDSDFNLGLRKIISDGFVDKDANANGIPILRPNIIGLSFEGYQNQYKTLRDKSIRLERVENSQRANQIALTWLTVAIAFGTLIEAVYYLLEIQKICDRYFWFQNP